MSQHGCPHTTHQQEGVASKQCSHHHDDKQQSVPTEQQVVQINSMSFDQVASGWDSNPNKSEFSRNVANGIMEVYEIARNQSSTLASNNNLLVMDYGAGTGTLSLMFLNHNLSQIERIDAVDVSSGMLSQLQDKITKLTNDKMLSCGEKIMINNIDLASAEQSLHPISLNKGKYNVIMSGMVFHHLADIPQKMKLISDYLAPGGVLIFTDIDKDEEHSSTFHCKHMNDAVQYKGGFSATELKVWLNEAGLVNEQFFRNVKNTKKGNDDVVRQFTLMTTLAFKPSEF